MIRRRGASTHANCDHLQVPGYSDSLNLWKRRRIYPLYLGAYLLQRPVAHLLAHDDAFRRDAEQHVPTAPIEHSAHGRCRLASRSRRGLQLQRLGFAGCNERRNLFRGHAHISATGRRTFTLGPGRRRFNMADSLAAFGARTASFAKSGKVLQCRSWVCSGDKDGIREVFEFVKANQAEHRVGLSPLP